MREREALSQKGKSFYDIKYYWSNFLLEYPADVVDFTRCNKNNNNVKYFNFNIILYDT